MTGIRFIYIQVQVNICKLGTEDKEQDYEENLRGQFTFQCYRE